MSLENLKRKYSYGPIPDWELAKLKGEAETVAEQPKKRGRKPKAETVELDPVESDVTDGDGN